jgi:hypothetical protein
MTNVPPTSKISWPDLRKPAGWAGLCQDVPAADEQKTQAGKLKVGTILNETFPLDPIPRSHSISP